MTGRGCVYVCVNLLRQTVWCLLQDTHLAAALRPLVLPRAAHRMLACFDTLFSWTYCRHKTLAQDSRKFFRRCCDLLKVNPVGPMCSPLAMPTLIGWCSSQAQPKVFVDQLWNELLYYVISHLWWKHFSEKALMWFQMGKSIKWCLYKEGDSSRCRMAEISVEVSVSVIFWFNVIIDIWDSIIVSRQTVE